MSFVKEIILSVFFVISLVSYVLFQLHFGCKHVMTTFTRISIRTSIPSHIGL